MRILGKHKIVVCAQTFEWKEYSIIVLTNKLEIEDGISFICEYSEYSW